MRLSRTKIAGCAIAVGALTHAAALTWYAHHIRATSGAALTVYGDVADLLDVLSAGLIGYTIVLLIMTVVFGRGAAIRWTTFGLICASVPVQLLFLAVHLDDHGHVFTDGQRVGDPTVAILTTVLATAAWMLVASLVGLWGLRRSTADNVEALL
jgi:hypothetical protein